MSHARHHRAQLRLGQSVDRLSLFLLVFGAVVLAGLAWLRDHPQHDPSAPLDLRDAPGWATQGKLIALRDDADACRAVLERSGVTFTTLDPIGEGACRREDRTLLSDLPLSPTSPAVTCPLGIGLQIWLRDVVQPAALEHFGTEVSEIGHYGAFSCRRINGGSEGRWSEHATGNAIDIANFTLVGGTRISVLADWATENTDAEFLRDVRNGACPLFATVLSPDYNEAHRDHFHFDMAGSWRGVCR